MKFLLSTNISIFGPNLFFLFEQKKSFFISFFNQNLNSDEGFDGYLEEDGVVQNDSLRTTTPDGFTNDMRLQMEIMRENAMTQCGNLFDRFDISLNVEINCDHRRCKFTCEDPNFRPTLRNAFCKNSRKNRWSPRFRNEKIECVERSKGQSFND